MWCVECDRGTTQGRPRRTRAVELYYEKVAVVVMVVVVVVVVVVMVVVAQEYYYIELVAESMKFYDNDEYLDSQLPLRHSSSHSE